MASSMIDLNSLENSTSNLNYFFNNIMTSDLNPLNKMEYEPWIFAVIGSLLIGLSGVFPILILPIDDLEHMNSKKESSTTMKLLLSFAVGGLLGDVFLHLLPEAWNYEHSHSGTNGPCMTCGLWVLAGLLVFVVAEKAFNVEMAESAEEKAEKKEKSLANGGASDVNANKVHPVLMSGYLNLMANSIDNFTHGLAVGGSFLISMRVGLLTTFAILIHEIPHEVGDFAILLRAGFSKWDATKAQLYTSSAGLVGALTAITCSGVTDEIEARTSWILPFTAGGFLHIGLVTILPELIREPSPRESLKQLSALTLGVVLMATLTHLIEE
ncbi:hypothetical protein WDU94_002399 [Cyamophila willieti]